MGRTEIGKQIQSMRIRLSKIIKKTSYGAGREELVEAELKLREALSIRGEL